MKLGKTAIQLIKSASRLHNLIGVDTGSYRARSYGYRSLNAARELEAAGLATLVNTHNGVEYRNGGQSCHYTSRVYKLTEAGIALKATL